MVTKTGNVAHRGMQPLARNDGWNVRKSTRRHLGFSGRRSSTKVTMTRTLCRSQRQRQSRGKRRRSFCGQRGAYVRCNSAKKQSALPAGTSGKRPTPAMLDRPGALRTRRGVLEISRTKKPRLRFALLMCSAAYTNVNVHNRFGVAIKPTTSCFHLFTSAPSRSVCPLYP